MTEPAPTPMLPTAADMAPVGPLQQQVPAVTVTLEAPQGDGHADRLGWAHETIQRLEAEGHTILDLHFGRFWKEG